MHEAANHLSDNGIKGLWKIGNSHVMDIIRNKENLNIKYNLIHQDDFERILQKNGLGRTILYRPLPAHVDSSEQDAKKIQKDAPFIPNNQENNSDHPEIK